MSLEYNHDHENEITLFGQTNFRNQMRRFGIKTDDRRRHMYIIGKTGMGKTTLIENMVLSDILAGHGCCYVDPHGDTAEKLLDFIPPHRINDVVYFNPSDFSYPLGFNILETVEDDKKHLVAAGLMGVFKKIWPDVWSPRMEYILLNCVLALLDYPGATLLGINRLLVDAEYRKRVISAIKDPVVKTFWVAEFSSWSEKYATEAIAPVQNKVGQFLSASIIRNIVAQVKSTIDLRDIMDSGKILIVNLSKGKIGEDNMRLLGGMLITKLSMAAMERVDIKNEVDRRDFYLFVDEFQNFANESFASILSEARKYHLNLIVAHQYIQQLDEKVASAIFGNVGTIITFRVGAEDAAFMEKEFMPTFTPEDLLNLAKYQVYLKLMVDGVATQPFSSNTMAPIAKRTASEQKVVAVSRERYASKRADIEEKVLRWSGMVRGDEPEGVSYPKILSEEEIESHTLTPRVALKDVPAQKPEADAMVDETKEVQEKSKPVEYLKISAERLAAISKPPQSGQQAKKKKPMFAHTCSRCGKVWEMPIQLDISRPIYCNECLPIIREEKKVKELDIKSAKREAIHTPARRTNSNKFNHTQVAKKGNLERNDGDNVRSKSEPPNRPRILGDLSAFLKSAKEEDEKNEEENGLLGQLMQSKQKPIEKNKERLTKDD
ncbi:type IV secretion system DNA-binding domain-containing protein [Candidatus Uhrbacteria bacterium]|nr:type IV secretion system DNA-binding domain-containing protein [Candidatus Uhrbacteria bacterium]